jgi:hypothetical protein
LTEQGILFYQELEETWKDMAKSVEAVIKNLDEINKGASN